MAEVKEYPEYTRVFARVLYAELGYVRQRGVALGLNPTPVGAERVRMQAGILAHV